MTAFHLFGAPVYRYGLALAAAALCALALMQFLSRREGLRGGTVSRFAVLAVPLALLCGHLAFCLTQLRADGGRYLFDFTRGYMLYGAMAGAALAVVLTGRATRQPAARVLDAAAAPAALAVALGRMAESLVGLGYGHVIEEWFDPMMEKSLVAWEDPSPLYRFPFAAQDYYGDWAFAIFTLEALAALALFVLLLRMKPRRAGGKALLFLLVYASCQAMLESLRFDAVLRWGFVKCNQLLSGLAVLLVIALCARALPSGRAKAALKAAVPAVLCAGVVMAMEFALEQKISFLTWMRMDVCWFVMAAAALGMLFSVLPLWRRAFPRA